MRSFRIVLSCLPVVFSWLLGRGQAITILSAYDRGPVLFAHVIISPLDATVKEVVVLSDTNGVAMVPPAMHNTNVAVLIYSTGYEKMTDTLVLDENKTYFLKPQKQVLNEVVITGQYAPNSPEKAVHKIKIIDRKKIDAQGAQNLRDVLTNEMNIRLSQDNILGSSMSLQGISGENVKLLIDGVPVIGRMNGNIDLSQINVNNVERIEIIEGPLSVNYGTNALAGVINLITRKDQKSRVDAGINSYYESIGQYNISARAGYKKNKSYVAVSGGRNFFDGWSDGEKVSLDFAPALADSNRYQSWKPKEQYFTNLQYVHQLNDLKINYEGNLFKEEIVNKGLPRAPYGETAFDDHYKTQRFDNAVSLSGSISESKNIHILIAQNHYRRIKNTYFRDLTTLESVLSENSSDQDTTRFDAFVSRGTYSTSKDSTKFNYEFGFDVNVETAYGLRIKNGSQRIGDYAVFSTAEYHPADNLTIRPGLRYAYNTQYKAPLIPSLNLKYVPGKSYAIRFSYAQGFRAPSLKELYFFFVDINHNIIGNLDLKAEKSHNLNLAVSKGGKLTSGMLRVEGSLFFNHIANLISLAQMGSAQYTYFNVGLYKTLGTQLTTEFALNHLKVSLGGSYVGKYNSLSEETEAKPFSYSPEARTNILYEFKKVGITAAFFYKYTGEVFSFFVDENGEVYETLTEDYHTADITVSKTLFKKKINLSIGSKNLFNVKNINSFDTGDAHSSSTGVSPIAMGRTFFIKLDINLNSKR